MKRIVKFLIVTFAFLFIPFTVNKISQSTNVKADVAAIYVASTGDDANDGGINSPYQTLEKALTVVENGGSIILKDTIAINDWNDHGKKVTISGGVLDASAWTPMVINDDVTFTNLTVKASEIYANGNDVVIGENVTMSGNKVYLYGGGVEGSTIENTNLTVLSGAYEYIFGGSYKAKITGDTNLTVGGTTSATYVFGGSNGSSSMSSIGGTAYLKISGGNFEGAYGGNQGTNCENDVDMEITGGKFIQVFGGGFKAYLTGNVNLRLLGGTITRRVYGGCYNETSGTSFTSSCYVNGKIYLTIGGDANIDFSSSESDRGIYARTRHKTEVNTELAVLTFADEKAYNNYKDKLGSQDWGGQLIMGSLTAADELHYYTYTKSGMTITQACAYCADFSATMEMALDESVSLLYTGEEIEPVIVTYSDNWVGEKLQPVYTNNTDAGKANCAISIGQVCVELDFVIVDTPVILGGSVRLSDPSGLRFQSIVPTGLKDSGVTFGTLIIPKAVLGENQLTVETAMVENITQKQWATEEVKNSRPADYIDGYEYFNAVMKGIPEAHYGTELVARSYVYANGQYYYSEEVTRSIAQVAASALADGYTNDILYTYVDRALEGVTLTMETEVTLSEGETEYQLTLEGNTNGYAVIWTSSNEDIITVDENGKLTVGNKQGRVVITAKLGSQIVGCTILITQWSKYY